MRNKKKAAAAVIEGRGHLWFWAKINKLREGQIIEDRKEQTKIKNTY